MTTQDPTAGGFPKPKREFLTSAIADAIAEAVAARHLSPGTRVVETTLAKTYETSRVPVREALKILHTQGILTGGGHRGYRVAEFSREQIAQVNEVRLMLEVILWRDALVRWQENGPSFGGIEAQLAKMEIAARTDNFRGILRCDLDFHRAVCEAAHNEIAYMSWQAIARHTLIIFNIARYRDTDLNLVVTRHWEMFDWLKARIDQGPIDEDEVRALLKDHMQIDRSPVRSPAPEREAQE
ncbi:GntR family transcriptional regulator [Pseudoroseicyclus tamaricis]|uniref:GntR family transcriptional regulator n=1 Tax=Pseudoroseicyclus tamaricis TaxID=2705421 RepID=A0A6B2JRD5_9RHOB|nr:GntR family transcriptional regulator [Pseudoroseicyclus tamaricis]NDV00555.1 GntR family transcriptional regulator [Pseudoroseicyclus tamaricis]